MRPRTVIEVTVERVDESTSELSVVTDDGRRRGVRSMTSRHATIDHAARRLAEHYGLRRCGESVWRDRALAESLPYGAESLPYGSVA